jgi:hypothetical protein
MSENEKGKYSNFLGSKPCLDEKRQADVCAVVAMGCTLQTAADFVGVGRRTVYRTALKNSAFGDALRKARSRGEITLVRTVQESALKAGEWKAATWLLAHCFRDKYYKRQRGIPVDQVQLLVQRITEALLGEVRDPADRKRMMARIAQICREVGDDVAADKLSGQET